MIISFTLLAVAQVGFCLVAYAIGRTDGDLRVRAEWAASERHKEEER